MNIGYKSAGIFADCRNWQFYKIAMGDFPSGAHWEHVPALMVRTAVTAINTTFEKVGLPYSLACDHGALSQKQVRKIFLFCGDGKVEIVKVQLTDFVVILNKRAISVKDSAASVNLIEGLIDVLEETLLPPPPKRRVGRPPKLRLPISGCMVKRTWQPEPRRTTSKRTPVARKTMLPKRPPLKKGDHRA